MPLEEREVPTPFYMGLSFLRFFQGLVKYAETDPPLIFGWENVGDFTAALPGLPAPPAGIMPPFAIPVPVTQANFKAAFLIHVRAPGSGAPVGTTVLPCTLTESHIVGVMFFCVSFPPAPFKLPCGLARRYVVLRLRRFLLLQSAV